MNGVAATPAAATERVRNIDEEVKRMMSEVGISNERLLMKRLKQ